MRNWLYVAVENPKRKVRFAAVSANPGGWAIGDQLFGIDTETNAIAEQLADRLLREHRSELIGESRNDPVAGAPGELDKTAAPKTRRREK